MAKHTETGVGVPTPSEPKREVINADEFAVENLMEVPIATAPDGTLRIVIVKQLDLLTMLWDGSIPEPMLAAAQDLIDLGGEGSGLSEMSKDQRADMLAMLRRYACSACVEPVFVMSKDEGGPDELKTGECPVARLSTQQLLLIYYAVPGKGGTRLTMDRARDFRKTGEAGSNQAPQTSDSVREAAEFVDHRVSRTFGKTA